MVFLLDFSFQTRMLKNYFIFKILNCHRIKYSGFQFFLFFFLFLNCLASIHWYFGMPKSMRNPLFSQISLFLNSTETAANLARCIR